MNYLQRLIKTDEQDFHRIDEETFTSMDLDTLMFLPNQMAYLVNCQTSEIEWIGGNPENVFGKKEIKYFIEFYKYIVDEQQEYVVNTTENFWGFAKVIKEDIKPWNTFCHLDFLIHDEKGKRKRVTRSSAAAVKDENNVIPFTVGYFTISELPLNFNSQPYVTGKCREYFSVHEVYLFKDLLSRRESEVLSLIALGYSTRQISNNLFISPFTVDTHRKHMIARLEVQNTPHLVGLAKDMGLI